MAKEPIDAKEIQQNTDDYMNTKGFAIKTVLGKFFLEQNGAFAYINGLVTAGTIFLLFFQNMRWPFFVWLSVMLIHSIIRMLYWGIQVRRADKELKRLDTELKELNNEIKKGKEYFEGLRSSRGK